MSIGCARVLCVVVTMLLSFGVVAHAAAEVNPLDRAPVAPVSDRGTFSQTAIELVAGKEAKNAVVSIEVSSFELPAIGSATAVVKLSAPWNDTDDRGDLFTVDGLANAIKGEVQVSGLLFSPPDTLDVAALQMVCDRAKIDVGESDADCNEELYERVSSPSLRRDIATAYFGDGVNESPLTYWSLSIGTADKDFKVLSSDLSERTQRAWLYSAALDVNVVWPASRFSIAFGYEWQDGVADASDSEQTLCVPVPNLSALRCKSGFTEEPANDDKGIVSVRFRKELFNSFGIAVNILRDTENDVTQVDLPIYFFRSGAGELNGGIRFSRDTKTEDVVGSVFVSSPFSL